MTTTEEYSSAEIKTTRLRQLLHYLIAIFVGLSVSYIIIVVFCPVFVSGSSMSPTLNNGDVLLATTSFSYNDLKTGDIIVFKDGKQLIKRIVAKEGDAVLVADGVLYVNGMVSPYQYEPIEDPGILNTEYTVPAKELFCLGDNRNNSYDCRHIGSVPISYVKSKVLKRILNSRTKTLSLNETLFE